MELFTLYHRYKMEKYLGVVSNRVFFLAHDSLKNCEVLCTIVVFSGLSEGVWHRLLCYYTQWALWLQKCEVDFISSPCDFGEFPTADLSAVMDCPGMPSPAEGRGCYFITPCSGWRLLRGASPGEVGSYLLPVLQALASLHQQGIFCYDLCPFSILYAPESPEPRVRLLNPGLIPPGRIAFPISPYTAPADILSKEDGRADLYSLAVSFYSLFTGKLPCGNWKTTLQTIQPAPIGEILEDCLTCSFKRFSSAVRIISALRKANEAYKPLVSRLHHPFPLCPDFDSFPLYSDLLRHISQLNSPELPQKIACFLSGEEGMGKTTFLKELKILSLKNELNVLFIPLAPHTDLFPIVKSLFDFLPEAQVDKAPEFVSRSLTMRIQETYLTVREQIVENILKKAEKRPLVILLDNLHWAGEEIFDLLKTILIACASSPSIPRLFLVGTGLSNGPWQEFCQNLAEHPLLRDLVLIEALPRDMAMENLTASALGIEKAPELFTARMKEASQGNPFHLEKTIQILLAQNALYWQEGEWYMEAESVDNLDLPGSLESSIKRYLNLIPGGAREMLGLFSAGFPIKLSALTGLSEMIPTIWRLYRDRTIEISENLEIFPGSATIWKYLMERRPEAPDFPKLLQETAGKLDSADRALFACLYFKQRQIARAHPHLLYVLHALLEAGFSPAIKKWLKKYFESLGKEEAPSEHLLYCGEMAFLLHDFELAISCLNKAKQCQNPLLPLLRGEIAARQKDFTRAAENLKTAKSLVRENSLDEVLYYRFKGYLKYLQQETGEFLHCWQKALHILESCVNSPGELLLTLYYQIAGSEIFLEFCEKCGKWLYKGMELARRLDNLPLVMHFLRLLAIHEKNSCHYEQALENFQKSLEVARNVRAPLGEILALLGIGETYLDLACYEKARDMVAHAEALSRQRNIEIGEGYASLLSGRLLACSKDYAQAIQLYRKALAILERHEENSEVAYLLGCLSEGFLGMEDMANTLDYLQQGASLAQKIGYPRLDIYFGLLKAEIANYEGQKPGRVLQLLHNPLKLCRHYGRRRYLWQLLYQRALAYQRAGDMGKALENFQSAWHIIEENAARLTRGLRETYLLSPRPKTIHDTLTLLTAQFSDVEGLQNRTSTEERKSTMDETRSKLDEIVTNCRRDVESSHLNALKEENERLKKLLEINKRLNCEHELQKLLDFIMDTAIEITKAERGFLILTATKEEKLFEVARNFEREDIVNPQFEVSHSITEKVIQTGSPVLSKDALEEFDGYRSVSELKLHSLLAVPLKMKERVVGALYIDNRFERAVFSEKEKVLLEAFADQAAIAIENTRLLQENMRLNQELTGLNAKLASKVENQKQEIQHVIDILIHSQHEWENRYRYSNIVGQSAPMQEVFRMMDKVADKNIPVFIHGESGTGKELVARAIHFNSSRRNKNFLSENCASITETLLESELFGHVKGAFTGAYRDKKGLFELADGGTLFLDEVSDMSPNMQASLLRVLEINLIRRVGGKDNIPVDVRIISASNKDLKAQVEKGEFRQDLFFRLKVVQINLPPLRQRREDIPLLIEHFLKEFARESSTAVRRVDKKALQLFMSYDWPGNIRELRNVLYNALSIYEESELNDSHFREVLTSSNRPIALFSEELSIDEYAKRFVFTYQNQYNDSQLARILGFSRKTLWEKRKKWELFRS